MGIYYTPSISMRAPESSTVCAPESSTVCINEDLKAISDDKSPSESSIIPPDMLNSRCPVRISFRLSPVSGKSKSESIHDYRYTEWHAGMHHDHTAHQYEYSLELDTSKVFKSTGEYYVIHRLIRSSLDGKLVEISGHCPHGDTSHACNCIKDLIFIYSLRYSQSEVLDNCLKEHVEMEMEKETQRRLLEAERGLAESERRLDESRRGLAESERGLAESERRLAESERELAESERKCAESERKCAESERKLADTMKRLSEEEQRYGMQIFK